LNGVGNQPPCVATTEFISHDLKQWADRHDIRLEFIQPGNPQQNAYVERYNRTVRYSWLSQYQFESISDGAGLCHTLALVLQSRTAQQGQWRQTAETHAGSSMTSTFGGG
jgi:transposase InsO family protein